MGGHHVAAAMGAHPFLSPHDAYQALVEQDSPDISEQPAVRRGRICEPGILEWLKEQGHKIDAEDYFISGEEWEGGTIDGVKFSGLEVFGLKDIEVVHEVTTCTSKSLDGWGPDGGKPKAYKEIQTLYYMGQSGAQRGQITLFVVDTGEIRQYHVGRDEERISLIRAAAKKLWERVESRDPPEQEKQEPTKEIEDPQTKAQLNILTEERDLLKARVKDDQDTLKEVDGKIKAILGDHDSIQWEHGERVRTVSNKRTKGTARTDYRACFEATKGLYPDHVVEQIIQDNTKTKEGHRVFRVTSRKKK